MSKYDGTETTMVPGTLRGYRAWRVTVNGLESITFQYVWGNTERARCTRYDSAYGHNAPVSGCTCGLYAKHTLEELEYEYGYRGLMLGSIRAHGRIILGDYGFRAEHAEIEALLWQGSPIAYQPDSRDLQKVLHSVPFYAGDRGGFLRDYPPIPVDHLLPEKPPTDQRMDWHYAAFPYGLEWKVEE